MQPPAIACVLTYKINFTVHHMYLENVKVYGIQFIVCLQPNYIYNKSNIILTFMKIHFKLLKIRVRLKERIIS